MTKSRGIGRGGARPGSGPKPAPKAGPTDMIAAASLPREATAAELARVHVVEAIATLALIAREGANEAARVAAAKALVEHGFGKPGPALRLDKPVADASDEGGDWAKLLGEPRPN